MKKHTHYNYVLCIWHVNVFNYLYILDICMVPLN